MKNTFGSDLSLTIFGESHGRAIGAVLDGMAAGLPVDETFLAARILETIGVHVPDTCRLAICEVPADHPFVLVEQMMPVLPIVRCQSFEQAVEDAVVAEHGNRHTASIFSKDVDHMTRFARVIETTIYVKNSATKAGVGIGGEGHCTMTIAGPTGEGITCAKSFCRRRRCMLAEGGLRII